MKLVALRLRLLIAALILPTGSILPALGENDPVRNTSSPSLLLNPTLVFDTANGQTHINWAVLVTSNHITAAGPT